ncbi:LOW QUALITY PROTEIN: uncharacterized protein LOC125230297 [Leguminivora glycinivorella]|uniref:LOW QUALITY PROTEIN: uncharacterized protein LOC125230297 n=1 Tax=Leguminivora glycinivorella TaxID=1035111 RepID=UPI00200F0DCB|nr:LOW QUALITY PROTEIN: uncharacterized protein LOC125230297 [Leguminivora glycinivorella]
MESITPKKIKSPILKTSPGNGFNPKTSISCSDVPESLLEPAAAKKHFSKFGKVQRIRLVTKKQMCIVEYDQPASMERAVLNAGAYDGFMFDVTRFKPRVRRKSKREDDPDWVPDSDVEEELSAMGGSPTYVTRQNRMDVSQEPSKPNVLARVITHSPSNKADSPVRKGESPIRKGDSPMRKKVPSRERPVTIQPKSGIESPVIVTTTQTTLSTTEAAAELHQLRFKVSSTSDEQWRILDARDRILRAWGGAGGRIKVGGATIGTCPDMCPEKERLHRQAEHQVMSLETTPDCDYKLETWRAVKQYSRSSADQEIPMCYELRPAVVLERTCAYLLSEIADTTRQVTLADWFHFMWDRFRGIRKDITQQALCCAESIRLVEMCARFHAHCAARLADLEHTQFDQKLNTDNLTKCLQTLKHMYADVGPDQKPREAEFRGYIALLNLGDANFWWEIKQLPVEIQKSEAITFAIKVFNALDNNNYVRFFRLVKEEASYLQACILLRYFNDVRARALARIVKAFAPRGGSRYPAEELMNALAFESVDVMKAFVNHYGLRFSKNDEELTVILDRNQFIEDSDPFPVARAPHLIESKRLCKVGAVIAGGQVPVVDFRRNLPYSSFNKDGTLKEEALTAQYQGYNTNNDSNKDVQSLRAEIQRLAQGGRSYAITGRTSETKSNVFAKPEVKSQSPVKPLSFGSPQTNNTSGSGKALFSFKPAIPVAPAEIINNSPEQSPGFIFSKPQEDNNNLFSMPAEPIGNKNIFGKTTNDTNIFKSGQNVFNESKSAGSLFQKPDVKPSVFGQLVNENKQESKKLFDGSINSNLFSKKDEPSPVFGNQNVLGSKNIFASAKDNLFAKPDTAGQTVKGSIFGKPSTQTPSSVFGSLNKDKLFTEKDVSNTKSLFATNGETHAISPGSLFKSAVKTDQNTDEKSYSIFQSKNKFNSVNQNLFSSSTEHKNGEVFDFNDDPQKQLEEQRLYEQKMKEEETRRLEQIRKEEELRQELKRQEEKRRQEELKREQDELRRIEEERKEKERKEEEKRKQEELKKRLEEQERKRVEEARLAELKRKAEEDRQFKIRVETESSKVTEEIIDEINKETVTDMMKDELRKLDDLMQFAGDVTEDIVTELCSEISQSEMLAEKIWTNKLMKKWFHIWRKNYIRNIKRRSLLEDTPVWLTDRTPIQEASCLKRMVENATLKNMNAIHKGYKFSGKLAQLPRPETLNLMEIIRSSLLKRMKQINYSYDKGLFWKVTLVSPSAQFMCRKINVQEWIIDSFSDRKNMKYQAVIYVGKETWNKLLDFAISVSLTDKGKNSCNEAMDGSNGLIYYVTEKDDVIATIEDTLKTKYLYQVIPIALIMPEKQNQELELFLSQCIKNKIISAYKIFVVEPNNLSESLKITTKRALKWLARNYPYVPPLEIDYVKSICERYLGNEIWFQLRRIKDTRLDAVMKDLPKLVQCYNISVEKLTQVITEEDLFNYPLFPLELKRYLNSETLYPKPYEFITSNAATSENVASIKNMMKHLKLPTPTGEYQPVSADNMQEQIYTYCTQIGWFQHPEKSTREITLFQLSDILRMPHENFKVYFEQFDLASFLNLIVYERIYSLKDFDNRFAIYEKSKLVEFRNVQWLFDLDIISRLKHKALDYEDDIDEFINVKRRKLALDSAEYLMIEDKDKTIVEDSIREVDENITKYMDCKYEVDKLEEQIEEERKRSMDLERLLRNALLDA